MSDPPLPLYKMLPPCESYRRIASESYRRDLNHWRSLAVISPSKRTEINPHRPCVRCAAIRTARLVFIRVAFIQNHSTWNCTAQRIDLVSLRQVWGEGLKSAVIS